MLISDLRDRVRRELVDFAWGEWVQLGVSGDGTRSDRWVIDPEAIVLFTIEVARRDPRLFDEMLDWLVLNGRSLSLQRLRNLTGRFPIDRDLVEAVVNWAGRARRSLHWSVHKRQAMEFEERSEPLFATDVVSFIPNPEPVFVSYGYNRPPVSVSGKSTQPDLHAPINLAFWFRLLFGPGSRSEVIRILLTAREGPLDAARIADEAAFTKRSVSDVLTAFGDIGVIHARWSANERVFLASPAKWTGLLEGATTPTYVPWVHLFPLLMELLNWLERGFEEDASNYLVVSRARDLVEKLAPDLEVIGVVPPRGRSSSDSRYLAEFTQLVDSLLLRIKST
jgi:hypothetical protein